MGIQSLTRSLQSTLFQNPGGTESMTNGHLNTLTLDNLVSYIECKEVVYVLCKNKFISFSIRHCVTLSRVIGTISLKLYLLSKKALVETFQMRKFESKLLLLSFSVFQVFVVLVHRPGWPSLQIQGRKQKKTNF